MLKLSGISKNYNKEKALDNLDLEVNDGDFITIIGSNGAGKSTLFNIISGTIISDSGTVELDDKDITFLKEYKRKDISHIFQDTMHNVCPDLTIEENFALAYLNFKNRPFLSTLSKKDKEFIREQCALLNMGLEDRLDTPIGLLSGGQRQALTLLLATLNKPKVLLLDEHTAALDPKMANKIMELTTRLVDDNKITTLMITHDINLALKTGNKTIMMDKGKIILTIEGEERKKMTYNDVLNLYASHLVNISDDLLLKSF